MNHQWMSRQIHLSHGIWYRKGHSIQEGHRIAANVHHAVIRKQSFPFMGGCHRSHIPHFLPGKLACWPMARGSILQLTWYFSSSPSSTACLKIILPQCADIESMSSSGMSIVQSLHCCHYYRYRVNACIANQFKRAMWGPWKIHQSTNSCESTSRWERRWQVFRRDMLGNCLALMVKWSIEAAGPIYHADTMHGKARQASTTGT